MICQDRAWSGHAWWRLHKESSVHPPSRGSDGLAQLGGATPLQLDGEGVVVSTARSRDLINHILVCFCWVFLLFFLMMLLPNAVCRRRCSAQGALTARMMLVWPEPGIQPVTTITMSPDLKNPRAFPGDHSEPGLKPSPGSRAGDRRERERGGGGGSHRCPCRS